MEPERLLAAAFFPFESLLSLLALLDLALGELGLFSLDLIESLDRERLRDFLCGLSGDSERFVSLDALISVKYFFFKKNCTQSIIRIKCLKLDILALKHDMINQRNLPASLSMFLTLLNLCVASKIVIFRNFSFNFEAEIENSSEKFSFFSHQFKLELVYTVILFLKKI